MAYVLGHNIHDASNVALPTDLPAKVSFADHLKLQIASGVIPCSQAYMCLLSWSIPLFHFS